MAMPEHSTDLPDAGSGPPNLRHLRAFLLVAEAKSITAAADKIHLSQPAITQAINKLELHFGARLFERQKSGMFLTASGDLLRARAGRAQGHIAEATREIAREARTARAHADRLMTTAQLMALIAVCEQGSFALAARATGLAQPTIHRAARELERNLGAALFERTSYGVKPTRAADRFATRAQLAFSELNQARAEIAAQTGREAGSTVIGALPLARSHLVPRAISLFCRRHPRHRIALTEGPYQTMLLGLRRGEIDFLVGALREGLPAPDVTQEQLFDDPLSIIMRAGHPLAREPTLSRRRLAAYPWVAPRRDAPLRDQFEDLFGDDRPDDVIECNALSASRVLLMDSDRLMLLSDAQTRYEREAGMLVSKPHPDGRIVRAIGLTTRRDWQPTAVQAELVEILREQARRE